jgi:hypothetical protein
MRVGVEPRNGACQRYLCEQTGNPGFFEPTTSRITRLEDYVPAGLPENTLYLPIDRMEDEEWSDIKLRGTESKIPQYYWDNGDYPVRSLSFWPVPNVPYFVELWLWQPITDWDNIDQELNLPPGYERALVYALAKEIAPEFLKEVPPDVLRIAAESLMEVQRLNQEIIVTQPSARANALARKGVRGFNIFTGLVGTPSTWWNQ